ncbi:MAG: hypothetical protein ACLU5G_09675 [Blautia sp.]
MGVVKLSGNQENESRLPFSFIYSDRSRKERRKLNREYRLAVWSLKIP